MSSDRYVLRVVMVDRWRTEMAIVHENERLPYGRRLVSIDLTEEQARALEPRKVGTRGRDDVHETVGEVWLERERRGT